MGTERSFGPRANTPGSVGRLTPALLAAFFLVAIAAVPRLADLDNRPMHCDEAVHGMKFLHLLSEGGSYKYDPNEYHGPGLNYLTLPIAWAAGAETGGQVTEFHLRLLPALFGIALVVLVWAARKDLGPPAAFFAAVLTAVSPAMVFYSRYYIQEMLLVFFTFAAMLALWRFAAMVRADAAGQAGPPGTWFRRYTWSVLLGVSAGMMHVSKETCIIAMFAMSLAGLVYFREWKQFGLKRIAISGLVVLATAASVSALFFSSFFDNPRGVVDSVTAYFHYAARAGGEGDAGSHDHPWHYYLRILFWWHRDGRFTWTEMPIAVLGAVGLAAAVAGRRLGPTNLAVARFLAVFTLVMIVVYAAIPYKTPWCALGFLHGMILLAGIGAQVLLYAARGPALKIMVAVLLAAAAGQLGFQAYRASFVAFEDPNNPYAYAPTTSEVLDLAERIRRIAAVYDDGAVDDGAADDGAADNGAAVYVQVICPDDDYWPLPWYLRDMHRVGWFHGKPSGPAAPLIVIRPSMKGMLGQYLYKDPEPGHRPLYAPVPKDESQVAWQLRPNVRLLMFARYSLLSKYRTTSESIGSKRKGLMEHK